MMDSFITHDLIAINMKGCVMPTDVLRANDEFVRALRAAVVRGGVDLAQVPDLLKRVIHDDCWRERVVVHTGEIVRFEHFEDFVTAPAPNGMGGDLPTLRRICADDPIALDLLDAVTQRPHGGDHTSPQSKCNNVPLAPAGNSSAKALRRLRKEAQHDKDVEALYKEVLEGALSPHAAAIKAGWRPKMVCVPLHPERAVRLLIQHFAQVGLLNELLAELRAWHERQGADVEG